MTKLPWGPLSIGGGLLGVFFVPVVPVQVFSWAMLGYGLVGSVRSPVGRLCWIGAVVFAWSSAFLLTPLAMVVPSSGGVMVWKVAFVILGMIWLAIIVPNGTLRWRKPSVWGLFGGAALALLCFGSLLYADLSFGGDETYHCMSIRHGRVAIAALLQTSQLILVLALWVATGIYLAGSKRLGSKGLVVWGGVAFAIAAVAVPDLLPNRLIHNGLYRGRILRFPGAQPWLAGLLGGGFFDLVKNSTPLGLAAMRMVPFISTAVIAAALISRMYWRKDRLVACVAASAIILMPLLQYYGTILYLELPIVALLVLVLADAKNWLCAEPQLIRRRACWLAVILLGFTKETVVPIVVVVALARIIWRVRLVGWRCLGQELIVGAGVVGPAFLYLWLRMTGGARPYGANFGHLLDFELWGTAIVAFVRQCGVLIPLALAGAVIQFRRGQIGPLLLGGGILLGLMSFLLCDHAAYIGLARFNLLVVAPIIWWSWEAFTVLRYRNRAGAVALAFIVIGMHVSFGPGLARKRVAWADAGYEGFYPYRDAYKLCFTEGGDPTILIANAPISHGHALIATWMGAPATKFALSARPESLESLLDVDDGNGAEFVVWTDESGSASFPTRIGQYERVRILSGSPGQLSLYRRRSQE